MEVGQPKQLVGQGKKKLRFEPSRKDVEKTYKFFAPKLLGCLVTG